MTVLRKDVQWDAGYSIFVLTGISQGITTAFKNFLDRVKKGQRVSEVKIPLFLFISILLS